MSTMIVVRRVRDGVWSHFPIRVSEWMMVYPAIGMALVLMLQPNLFAGNPAFSAIERWGDERFWTTAVLLIGLVRLIALTVNGTFATFKYSPHIRLAASIASITFWSQFTLGILVAAVYSSGSWTGVVAFSTFCLAELANIYRTWVDVTKRK